MFGTEEVVIRNAGEGDLGAIQDLMDQAYGPYINRMDGQKPGPMLDDYAQRIRDQSVYVATDGHLVICGALVMFCADNTLYLDNIAVAQQYAGRGIGRKLFEFAEQVARSQNCARIELYTNVIMTESIDLYRRSGWSELGEKTVDGYRRIYFEKPVSKREF